MAGYGRAVAGAAVLAAAVLTFSATALAAPGNGNGNGNGNSNGNAGDTPAVTAGGNDGAGKSADAPGQVKKDVQPETPAPAPVVAGPTDSGVKPSNTTAKNTSCVSGGNAGAATCAAPSSSSSGSSANPDASKKYGNGATAAQIAVSRGGSGVTIHGPGNSQPHKVTPCGRKHEVDVHAVKKYGAGQCESSVPPTHNPSSSTPPPAERNDDPRASTQTQTTVVVGSVGGPKDPATRDPRVDAEPTRTRHASAPRGAARALAAVGSPASGGTLPFTGFPLWLMFAAGTALLTCGAALRRRAAVKASVNGSGRASGRFRA